MEVHHHAHTSRKKWAHYFWEFLMLFLAVFCGFLAENQREHMVEHNREKQYIKSLTKDLRSDIRQVDSFSQMFKSKLAELAIVFDGLNERPSLYCLQHLFEGVGFPDFIYTDQTIQQLKGSGNLRLIRNQAVADSIGDYDLHVRSDMIHQEILNRAGLPTLIDKIKNAIDIKEWYRMFSEPDRDSNTIKNSVLLIKDRTEIIGLRNEFFNYRSLIQYQWESLEAIKIKASRLLSFINKEYHLN